MAFSLTCDAGKTTLRIEGADTGVSFADVYDEGAASVAVDGGGTEDVDFFITEYIEDVYYEILKNIEFGDGTNTFTFSSTNESVYFVTDASWQVQANATLTIGELDGNYTTKGAFWSVDFRGYGAYTRPINSATAVFELYGSSFYHRSTGGTADDRMWMVNGHVTMKNSIIGSHGPTSEGAFSMHSGATVSMEDVYISNCVGIYLAGTPELFRGIWVHNCLRGIISYVYGTIRASDCKSTEGYFAHSAVTGTVLEMVNPSEHLTTDSITIGSGDDPIIREVRVIDAEVLDQESRPIEGAVIKHWISESSDGGTTWGAYSYVDTYTTDADGLTGEQDFYWAEWETTSENETQYQHRLEITAAGQSKQVLNNIRPNGSSLPMQFQPPAGIFFHGSRTRMAF